MNLQDQGWHKRSAYQDVRKDKCPLEPLLRGLGGGRREFEAEKHGMPIVNHSARWKRRNDETGSERPRTELVLSSGCDKPARQTRLRHPDRGNALLRTSPDRSMDLRTPYTGRTLLDRMYIYYCRPVPVTYGHRL